MPNTLVVVESPAKAKTIEKYLGGGFTVRASYGHIRDLPKSPIGVDVENDFEPEYIVPEDSKRHADELSASYRRADDLILATDYDREGEAIAFHVATILGVEPTEAKRATFTEITRDAIIEAIGSPRRIDMKLVDAQQARRILDRLVGYKISPILWKRVRPGLSAGRVQSVAVRLIVEREREIEAFNPVEYWSVDVRLTPERDPEQPFLARLTETPEGRLAAGPDKKGLLLSTEAEAAAHVGRLRSATYKVGAVERKQRKRSPAPPFTTSTLQQEAARKLGFGARKTMSIAQRLYEGITLPGEGAVGLITYMRTDSFNVADSALHEIGELVRSEYGKQYSLSQPRRYKTRSRNAQEAHEAIRPTSAMRTPQGVAPALERDQLRLYTLIWQRTMATQMADALFDQVGVDVEATAPAQNGAAAARYGLRATGQTLVFDGFIRIYKEGRDEGADEDAESMLPDLTAEQLLRMLEVLPEQHFTQPPPRYSEASLVKTLEELGIGRPSTYASIISTIQDRGYVRLEDKRFFPEDVGVVVTDKLVEHFPDVVDVNFTAHLEEELDDIAEGQIAWTQVLHEFNGPFERALEKAEHSFERFEESLDEPCPLCPTEGREPGKLQVKLGRYGKFIGCDKYPECRYIRNMDGTERAEPELLDERCPECGRQLQQRVGRFGPFVGCSGYPDCTYIRKDPPKSTGVTCPECNQGELVEKRTRFGMFYGCSRYPDCTLGVNNPPIPDRPCPECGSLLLQRPKKGPRCWNCGAELDDDFNVVVHGDPQAEAAARAAKAAAREARAAARGPKGGRKTTQKTTQKTTKKKTTARKTTARKTTAKTSRKTTARRTSSAEPPAPETPPASEQQE
jgi:DNA topoisomerase I